MSTFQNRVGLLKIIGLLIVLWAVAGGLYIANSRYFLYCTSEVLAGAFSHDSLNNNQVATNVISYDTKISNYYQVSSLHPINLNDPYINQQWAINRINAFDLYRVDGGNVDTIVAILDTGIDKYHEDLADVVINEANFTDSTTLNDINGHGTHIAGIISATSNNNKGIVGLAPGVFLMNVKVADDTGQCQPKDVAHGIIWAVDNGAKVINISLEFAEASEDVAYAIEYAWGHGALVIAAAGNDGNDTPVYPASYKNVIAVAAITMEDCLAPLSNYGEWTDVAAPGMNIYSLLTGNKYGYKTGTSFAAAHVSGLAAILFYFADDINGNGYVNDEVRDAIESNCDKIGTLELGNGCINASASLAKIYKTRSSLNTAHEDVNILGLNNVY